MIVIVDYGAGNLRSVANAICRLKCKPKITSSPDDIGEAQAVIMPGVGAAADTLVSLKTLGLIEPIRHFIAQGRPFLGVCIGLQILFNGTEEGGWLQCLGILPGLARKLPTGPKIPHIGWNQVKQKIYHPIFDGIPDESYFYFVHSYYVEPDDESIIAGETEYGISMCSVIAKGNLIATQFHPERSGEVGIRLYDNFIKIALGAKVSGL